MTFCSFCGVEISSESNFCSKCGKPLGEKNGSLLTKARSKWWFLLPILFHVIGGVIAYFVVRDDDPKLAKNCLWLGIIISAIEIAFVAAFWIPLRSMPHMGWNGFVLGGLL
ncbi:MAG TPA: zinc ribbon domain-containing protein [Nitrosopumilaceae archaeon]|nr:zinc ribbon domain-containing protein [Nitrosopumilaceae archaeon]